MPPPGGSPGAVAPHQATTAAHCFRFVLHLLRYGSPHKREVVPMTPWKTLRTVFLVAVFVGAPMLRMPSVASAQDEGPKTLRGDKATHDERVEMLREEFRERQRGIR